MISGDGIYSRYLTQYHDAGRYSFDVTVHDNRKGAFTIRNTPMLCRENGTKLFIAIGVFRIVKASFQLSSMVTSKL